MQLKNKLIVLSAIFALLNLGLAAQTFSPYSQYGLGDQRNTAFSANRALGGISAGYSSSRNLNFNNPASYADLTYTVFELGALVHTNVLSDSLRAGGSTNGGVSHLALGFPIKQNKWGLSFGLLPNSYSNYKFTSSSSIDGVDFKNVNTGYGSTYQFYIGNGFKFGNFSVGLNAGYLFGGLEYNTSLQFQEGAGFVDAQNVNELNVKNFVVNAGVQYKINLSPLDNDENKQDVFLTLGLYGTPPIKGNANYSKYLSSTRLNALDQISAIDTASGGMFDSKAALKLPASVSAGFTLGNELSWLVGADFHYENWTNFESPISNYAFVDDWKFKLGAQITPKFNGNRFGQRIEYRFGAHLGNTRLTLENTRIPEFGTTFGFGIPFKRVSSLSRSLSVLNLSMEIGKRGIVADNLLKENYYKLTIGYTLSDRWFVKRKFD